MSTHFSPEFIRIFSQLVLSLFLGSIVGWERERHESPAGLRTHILVCLGATLYTMLGQDSSGRIAANIVTGVGFLGAGTIMRSGVGVRGLTTAASLWAVAAIGMGIGIGRYGQIAATTATAIVLFTLTVLGKLDVYITNHRQRHGLICLIAGKDGALDCVSDLLRSFKNLDAGIAEVEICAIPNGLELRGQVRVKSNEHRKALDQVIASRNDILYSTWS